MKLNLKEAGTSRTHIGNKEGYQENLKENGELEMWDTFSRRAHR